MGMGGGGGKSTTEETKEVKLPPWVDAQAQSNLAFSNQVANRPYEANPYQTVSPLDALAWQARGNVGKLDDMIGDYGKGNAALQSLLGYNPNDIKASTVGVRSLADTNLQPYMNPYTQEVESNALRAIGQTGREQQRDLAADATAKKAFGGTRQAVQAGVQGAQTAQKAGDLSAQLRKENFTQAQQAATGDIQREYAAAVQRGDWAQAAQIASVSHDLEAHQQSIAAAKGMADNATAYQNARMNQIATELGVGQVFQDQKQREADLKAGKWQSKHDYPLEQLNIRLAALGMTPYGHTETGTSTTRQKGGGSDPMSMIGGGMGLLKMLMSDEREKTDVQDAGTDPSTGLPLKAFRYKGDPKHYPKVVGPMAQDVQRKFPKAVKTLGGRKHRKVIDLTRAV